MKLKEYFVSLNLPESLLPLKEMACNLCWTYNSEIKDVFRYINQDLWTATRHNPIEILYALTSEDFERLQKDNVFLSRMETAYDAYKHYIQRSKWFDQDYTSLRDQNFHTAYFSAEYGIHQSLQLYSGGLGLLSGDHCKSVADLGIPFTGVGLLYRSGYFHQYLNSDGWQQESYPYNEFSLMPIYPILKDGQEILVDLKLPEGNLKIKLWELKIGQMRIVLLDTDIMDNPSELRNITGQLYGGDITMRIKQEVVLGIGGARALKVLGLTPTAYHLNEGHPAFASLERIRQYMQDDGLSYDKALEMVRKTTVFTTHTPVPAGFDLFLPDLFTRYMQAAFDGTPININEIIKLGRVGENDASESFSMALLGIKTSTFRNGVSKMHGQVSRRIFNNLWPGLREGVVPIDHITNGVHLYSWVSGEFRNLYDRYLGEEWVDKPYDFSVWKHLKDIPDFEIFRIKQRLRTRLVAFARQCINNQNEAKTEITGLANAEYSANVLNPDALTIGFARRFATYKRAFLLFSDEERLARILNNPDMPVQIIIAGKAHPKDADGKKLIKQIVHATRQPEFKDKIVFLEDYDIGLAKQLVAGIDVWLNNPKRPMEASGTSGMKVAVNGGVNFSVLDGWWAEGYNCKNGFAIGSNEKYQSEDYENYVESRELYDHLENEIIPTFYNRDSQGIPHEWVGIIKNSLASIPPYFNTSRMVMEYCTKFYAPLHELYLGLTENNYAELHKFTDWQNKLRSEWGKVKMVSTDFTSPDFKAGGTAYAKALINISSMQPEDFCVYAFVEYNPESEKFINPIAVPLKYAGQQENLAVYEGDLKLTQSGKLRVAFAALPCHKFIKNIFDDNLLLTED